MGVEADNAKGSLYISIDLYIRLTRIMTLLMLISVYKLGLCFGYSYRKLTSLTNSQDVITFTQSTTLHFGLGVLNINFIDDLRHEKRLRSVQASRAQSSESFV